nr:unnamed protein product [Digitaria exilis]
MVSDFGDPEVGTRNAYSPKTSSHAYSQPAASRQPNRGDTPTPRLMNVDAHLLRPLRLTKAHDGGAGEGQREWWRTGGGSGIATNTCRLAGPSRGPAHQKNSQPMYVGPPLPDTLSLGLPKAHM